MLYNVYWNNVCLLSNQEEKFINKIAQQHPDFPFSVSYYGLGKPAYLSHIIEKELSNNTHSGDVVVSTDLDIFHNPKLKRYFHQDYHQISWVPVRPELTSTTIKDPLDHFQPFIVIPLVMIINNQRLLNRPAPTKLADLLNPAFKGDYAFGGLHNSAGRTLLQAIWYLYGEQSAREYLANAVTTTMPAQAFQQVMAGKVTVAIVPTIFALRRGINNLVACWPEEGAVAIPSYVAVKKTVPVSHLQLLADTILGSVHQEQLVKAGDIIPSHPQVNCSDFTQANNCRLLYPSWDFYNNLDFDRFHNFCQY